MPQEFHVLRCYSCNIFQVHIVKKANKWECKVCGGKQSVKKNYGIGSAKDCRLRVQNLNEMHIASSDLAGDSDSDCDEPRSETSNLTSQFLEDKSAGTSKWSKYLSTEAEGKSDASNLVKYKRKEELVSFCVDRENKLFKAGHNSENMLTNKSISNVENVNKKVPFNSFRTQTVHLGYCDNYSRKNGKEEVEFEQDEEDDQDLDKVLEL